MPAETEHRLTADAAKARHPRIFGFAIRRRRYPERRRQSALALIGEAPGPGRGRAALGGQRPRQAFGAERMRAPIGIDRQPRRRRHERTAERAPQYERRKNLRQCFGEARDRLAIALRFQVLPRGHRSPGSSPKVARHGARKALNLRHHRYVMVRRHTERESDVKKWLGVLLLPFFCGASLAQTASYPDRPITLIVTAAAGGVTDVAARAVGQELGKAWGQPVIVENRGGAAHILGAQSVAKADPDGYTLMVGEAGTFTINPTVYPPGKLPYDTDRDFVPISGLVRINQSLIADNNLPAANAAELIALAKQKPGQLTYGTAGIGSAPHMNMALFESMAGVKL